MELLFERVQRILADLNAWRIAHRRPLDGWQVKEGFYLDPKEAAAAAAPYRPFDADAQRWKGGDRHYWFRIHAQVPPEMAGQNVYLSIATQVDYWDAVNPQFLVFVDGELKQGADVNHRSVLLTPCAQAGQSFLIELQAYSGTDTAENAGLSRWLELHGELVTVDARVQELYYDLSVLHQTAGWLPKEDYRRMQYVAVMNEAVNLLDLRDPARPEFAASVERALGKLKGDYAAWRADPDVVASCVGHTHIDVAWQWTVEQTKEKAARSFATALKYMDEYPAYRFMSSQPQLYQFVKERYPQLYEGIRRRIQEGRWEAEGGMWLEADCNLTSGESLVRQFLYGKAFFKQEFNVDSVLLWLPDVFGYTPALPQIMKKSGIRYFMTTKIAWNQFNRLPVDTFWWEGIDGSRIFTHLITTQNRDQPLDSFFTTYNGYLDPVTLMRTWDRYQQKALNNDVLVSFGYGDGGGGPTRDMLETVGRLERGLPGVPRVRQTSARQYFDELYARLKDHPELPAWVGELYLEYHRGTYTSMARNKRDNRRCEQLFQQAELLGVWARELLPYPKAELDAGWRNILLNQFHDILPGSSIEQVYEVTDREYRVLKATANRLIDERVQALVDAADGPLGGLGAVNTLPMDRVDVVEVDSSAPAWALDGQILPSQRTAEGKLLTALPVPAHSVRVFTPAQAAGQGENPLRVQGNAIETPYYQAELDACGRLVSLWDRRNQRQVLSSGAKGNALVVYEDKPLNFDNWDIDIYHTQKGYPVEQTLSAQWVEYGPVRAVYQTKLAFLDSVIQQRICFYAHTPRIDFITHVDWKQRQNLLTVAFPVDVHANEATYDIAFGNISRPTHQNTSWDMARFEVCAHKWADLSEDGYGVSLLNDCKYGHSIQNGVMRLSLIKSGILPNPHADQEAHDFTYALYPHAGTWRQADTVPEAYQLNIPLRLAVKAAQGAQVASCLDGVDASHVMLETVKQAEDGNGVIVRLVEYKNRRGRAALRWGRPLAAAKLCDLMEADGVDAELDGQTVVFDVHPYEIVTLRLQEE